MIASIPVAKFAWLGRVWTAGAKCGRSPTVKIVNPAQATMIATAVFVSGLFALGLFAPLKQFRFVRTSIPIQRISALRNYRHVYIPTRGHHQSVPKHLRMMVIPKQSMSATQIRGRRNTFLQVMVGAKQTIDAGTLI